MGEGILNRANRACNHRFKWAGAVLAQSGEGLGVSAIVGRDGGFFCTFPPPISPEDLLLRHPKPRGRRGSVNGGRMRGLPSATVGKALSSSPMLLRRVFASLPRLDVVCSYPLAGVTPVRLSGPPGGGNRLAFRRECLGSCLMASSCRTEGARRSPYVPLPPPTADKVGVLFLFR